MVRRRLIFTLLYDRGSFMLSRNFRLQRVGDVDWLNRNYNFSHIATAIDELVILDVTRGEVDTARFCADVRRVTENCFMPLALGGGIRSAEQAPALFAAGTDKIVMNTALYRDRDLIAELVSLYGSQCVIAAVDYRLRNGEFAAFVDRGGERVPLSFAAYLEAVADARVGEVYLNSIDQDGTGNGYCLPVLDAIAAIAHLPVIMAGGAGNHHHLLAGINHPAVDAVATANLFNFIGDGLPSARRSLLDAGVDLARW